MYESYFHFKKKPFELLPNPDFLYPSKSHRKVLTYLDYGIRERSGFILLTGEVGTGKTTIIREIIKKHLNNVLLARIFHTKVESLQLLAMINEEFGLSTKDKDKPSLLRELHDFLIEQYTKKRPVVLIIDEAQNLSRDVLEEVRMLSNLETADKKLIHIILVGQPELRRVLGSQELLQLRQRIQINCHIDPIPQAETGDYILHRLEAAGNRDALTFAPECFPIISSYARGIPRLINILCDYILLDAFANEASHVTGETIHEIARDISFKAQYWESCAGEPPAKAVSSKLQDVLTGLNRRLCDLETASKQNEAERSGVKEGLSTLTGRIEDLKQTMNQLKSVPRTPVPARTAPPWLKKLWKESLGNKRFLFGFFTFAGLALSAPSLSHAQADNATSARAGLTYHGSIQVSEEYNDNVNETRRPKADTVTVLSPALDAAYAGNRVNGALSYRGDLLIYNTGQRENEMINTLDAKASVNVTEKTLVLDVSDHNAMVFHNAFLGTPTRADSTRNQVNQNIASAGLTFTPNVAERTHPSLAYRITATLYGARENPDMLTQDVSLDVLHDLTQRAQAGFGARMERQLVDKNGARTAWQRDQGDVTRFIATLVGNYAYAEHGLIFCRAGVVDSLYDTGAAVLYPTWSAGLTQAVGKTTLTLQTQADYQNNPGSSADVFQTTYVASAAYASGKATVTLRAGYSEYFGSSTHYAHDFTAGADIAYDLTDRLKLSLGAHRAGWDESFGRRGNPIRYYGDAQILYQLPKDFAVKLYYQGKMTPFHRAGQRHGNGNVNIIGVGLSASF